MSKASTLIAVFIFAAAAYSGVAVKYSAAFSFPSTVSLDASQVTAAIPEFTCRYGLDGNGPVSFTWNVKNHATSGRITVYSISGKAIHSFLLNTPSGATIWSLAKNPVPAGVYFARFHYGSANRTAKLIIIN